MQILLFSKQETSKQIATVHKDDKCKKMKVFICMHKVDLAEMVSR